MRRAVCLRIPELLGCVDLCYANKEDLQLWCGDMSMRSRTGCQKRDPLGPLLFSLVLHDLVSVMPRPPRFEGDQDASAAHLACDDGGRAR